MKLKFNMNISKIPILNLSMSITIVNNTMTVTMIPIIMVVMMPVWVSICLPTPIQSARVTVNVRYFIYKVLYYSTFLFTKLTKHFVSRVACF